MVRTMTATVRRGQYEVMPLGGSVTLVKSASDAAVWHEVVGGRCDCRGYLMRGHCSHTEAVASLACPVAASEPTPAPTTTRQCATRGCPNPPTSARIDTCKRHWGL